MNTKKPDWHDAICADKPILCWVSDNNKEPNSQNIHALITRIQDSEYPYKTTKAYGFKYATPVKPDEITIWSEPNEDGWIEWNGGECPVGPDVVVEVILRNGLRFTEYADGLMWSHEGRSSDIVKYRVIKD